MIGIVEDNYDPMYKGRVRVRIYGVTDQKNEDGGYVIPSEMLPWAIPTGLVQGGSTSGAGEFSVPKIGSVVRVNGTINNPEWDGNMYVSDEVSAEIGTDFYTSAHVLIYDTNLANDVDNFRKGEYIKVFFTEEKGFVIDFKNAYGATTFNMTPEGELNMSNSNGDCISLKNGNVSISSDKEIVINSPCVKLGTDAVEGLLKGNKFLEYFNAHTHMVNGVESEPPNPAMNPDVVSSNVYV